ncbi:MAG: C39 family peptidase [Anaerococcus sp.]|nr:C39 family peptidase [Anaerococcus sp.]
MKNKKILLSLVLITSLLPKEKTFAKEDLIKDPDPYIEEFSNLAGKDLESEPLTSERKEGLESLSDDGIPTNPSLKEVKEEESEEVIYQDYLSLEDKDFDKNLSLHQRALEEKDFSQEELINAGGLDNKDNEDPVVYYDQSKLDDILTKDPSYVREEIEPTGRVEFVEKSSKTYLYNKDGKLAKNQKLIIEDKFYRTDSSGRVENPKNSWLKIEDKSYRTQSDGTILKGFNKIGGYDYYFDKEGILARNSFIKNDRTIFRANDLGVLSKAINTWADIGANRYRTDQNARSLVGKHDLDGRSFYFAKDKGLIRDGYILADGGRFRADSKGLLSFDISLKPGWTGMDGLSYYYLANGKLARGLFDTGAHRYFFDRETGQMARNEINSQGPKQVYSKDNGVSHYIGWDYYKGKLAYVKGDGTLTKGLKTIGGMTYGFDQDGRIFNRQYKNFDGQWWYFNKYGEGQRSNGQFATGWVGDRYYFADGKPAEGLQTIGGVTYIFHELTRQIMRNTTKVIDFNKYRLDSKGHASLIGRIDTRPVAFGTRGEFNPGFSQYLNRKTPYFNQRDPRWANRSYSSETIGGLGCGPTAMAMVLNRLLGRDDIYPTNTMVDARDYENIGTEWQYFRENPKIYGLESYEVPINKEAFIQALDQGPMVVRVGPGYYINAGHYLVIDSYKDGNFIINDPYNSRRNTLDNQSFWRLKQEVTIGWLIK